VVHVRGVRPNNYIILAVIGILFFWPTGIIALMYALQVNSRYDSGNPVLAQYAAINARRWGIISIVVGVILSCVSIGLFIVGPIVSS
jgi:hypothetical protein